MKRTGAANVHERYAAARKQMIAMPRHATSPATMTNAISSWQFLGPGNIGGRTRTFIIDPENHDVLYSGGVSGGVWKSINGGQRWEPIGDVLTNLAVNSLIIDPRDSRVLYAGTGEGYFREDVRGTALPLRGNGIYVTRDGGSTWRQLESTAGADFHWVNDLAIRGEQLFAATRTGTWRSTDKGETWTRVLPTAVRGGCLDLAGSETFLFASCGTFEQATVYRTQDGEKWDSVLSEPNMGRTSLAIAPSQPSTIYALSASNGSGATTYQAMLAVYRSDSSGDAGSWKATVRFNDATKLNRLLLTNPIPASGPECGGGSESHTTMGWYCNVIEVDPKDPEIVWAAGVDLFRSDDGGRNWGLASYWWAAGEPSFAHADQHRIVFHPDYDGVTNATMFAMTDGGVYRTDNARSPVARGPQAPCDPDNSKVAFTSLNHNFGVTQFYNGTVFPDGDRFIGGAQDNGTLLGTIDSGIDGWKMVWGGDGAYVAVDPRNPSVIYASSQVGNIVKSTDGGATFRAARNGVTNEQFLFIAPFVMDPSEPSTLFLGGRRLWKTTNAADSWTAVTGPLDALVSAIAVGPGGRVLAGTANGSIYRSTGGSQFTSSAPRSGFVSSLAFDAMNPSLAYATYAGFGGEHVWKSNDGGATWTAIGNGLPDIPVHSIAIDPNGGTLYLGTDLGVFTSTDRGASWMVENTGFAPAVTETVVIAAGHVYAFTHGRGAWRAELPVGPRSRGVRR
jgi:photosystem II stability/assembly factor-like uncharacterized protein